MEGIAEGRGKWFGGSELFEQGSDAGNELRGIR